MSIYRSLVAYNLSLSVGMLCGRFNNKGQWEPIMGIVSGLVTTGLGIF